MLTDELLRFCRTEASRCRKAVAKGSPRAFWVSRIKGSLQRIDEARAVMQAMLEELSPRPEAQDGNDGGGNRDDDNGGS